MSRGASPTAPSLELRPGERVRRVIASTTDVNRIMFRIVAGLIAAGGLGVAALQARHGLQRGLAVEDVMQVPLVVFVGALVTALATAAIGQLFGRSVPRDVTVTNARLFYRIASAPPVSHWFEEIRDVSAVNHATPGAGAVVAGINAAMARSAEMQQKSTSAYWSRAVELVVVARDGSVEGVEMPNAMLRTLGPELVRALSESAA